MGWAEIGKEQHQEITNISKEAMAPSSRLAQEYLSNVNFNPQSQLMAQDPQMYGFQNKAMLEAVQRKSDVRFNRDMDVLKKRAGIDAVNDKFNRLNAAAGLVNAEFQHNERVKAAKHAEKMNRKAARANVLGNVLGIAGAVVGGVYGGPVGAAAGYGLGQGAGQMIGGS